MYQFNRLGREELLSSKYIAKHFKGNTEKGIVLDMSTRYLIKEDESYYFLGAPQASFRRLSVLR